MTTQPAPRRRGRAVPPRPRPYVHVTFPEFGGEVALFAELVSAEQLTALDQVTSELELRAWLSACIKDFDQAPDTPINQPAEVARRIARALRAIAAGDAAPGGVA